MLKSKILSLLLGTVALGLMLYVVLQESARFEKGGLASTQGLLEAAALQAELHVAGQNQGLDGAAATLAAADGLGKSLDKLNSTLNGVKAGAQPNKVQQNRIDKFSAALDEQLATFREARRDVSAASIINDVGVVMTGDSELFRVGVSIAPDAPAEGDDPDASRDEGAAPPDAGAAGEPAGEEETQQGAEPEDGSSEVPEGAAAAPADTAAPSAGPNRAWVAQVLSETPSGATLVEAGRIFYVNAAPIYKGNKLIGAAVVERQLQSLPPASAASTVLLVAGAPILGSPPEGFVEPSDLAGRDAFLLAERDSAAELLGVGEISYTPMFVAPENVGVWGSRFSVKGTDGAWGYAYADLSGLYASIGAIQLKAMTAAFLVWLAFLGVVVMLGWRTSTGVDNIADFLGRLHQGIGDQRKVRETHYPGNLRRLVKLVNKTVESMGSQGVVQPLPKAPSVDDVLEAQEVQGEPEDLEFEGISNAGTLSLADVPHTAVEGVGSHGDGFDGSIADLQDMVTDDQPTGDLPGGQDASAALNDLDGGAAFGDFMDPPSPTGAPKTDPPPSSGGPPPPPPDAVADIVEDAGAAPGADFDATIVQPVSADLMAQLKQAGADINEPDAAPAGPPPPPDDAMDEEDATMAMEAEAEAEAEPEPEPEPEPQFEPAGPPPLPAEPTADDALNTESTAVMKVTPDLLDQLKEVGLDEDSVAVKATPPPVPDVDPIEEHFKEVFEQFVQTRKECGESGDLNYAKFKKRLEQTRSTVMQKHSAKDVKFQVYVKNGKAALKASPSK